MGWVKGKKSSKRKSQEEMKAEVDAEGSEEGGTYFFLALDLYLGLTVIILFCWRKDCRLVCGLIGGVRNQKGYCGREMEGFMGGRLKLQRSQEHFFFSSTDYYSCRKKNLPKLWIHWLENGIRGENMKIWRWENWFVVSFVFHGLLGRSIVCMRWMGWNSMHIWMIDHGNNSNYKFF